MADRHNTLICFALNFLIANLGELEADGFLEKFSPLPTEEELEALKEDYVRLEQEQEIAELETLARLKVKYPENRDERYDTKGRPYLYGRDDETGLPVRRK